MEPAEEFCAAVLLLLFPPCDAANAPPAAAPAAKPMSQIFRDDFACAGAALVWVITALAVCLLNDAVTRIS
jgi:hypothetical protein